MIDISRPRHVVSPTLAESMRQAEASSFLETRIQAETDSAYMEIKTRLLEGEITVDEAVELYCLPYTKKDMTPPQDDPWRSDDYDDEPRSNGNFGLDPFQQECKAILRSFVKPSDVELALPCLRGLVFLMHGSGRKAECT